MEIPTSSTTDDEPTSYRFTTPLDQWRQLPTWKRIWFEKLSERDLDMIFPSEEKNLDEWMKDRTYVRNRRRFSSRAAQLLLTAVVGLGATAVGSVLWMGIQGALRGGGVH